MIYLLSKTLQESAQSLCDTHLSETILDTGMAISYYLWVNRRDSVAFDAAVFFTSGNDDRQTKITRAMYPLRGRKDMCEWVTQSPNNYTFFVQYQLELLQEYLYRFATEHKVAAMIETLPKRDFVAIRDENFPEIRLNACVELYKQAKPSWKWTNRDKPRYAI